MKKFFYLGAILMLMASCGSGETSKSTSADEDTASYYDCDPNQIDQAVPSGEYEGNVDESDANGNGDETTLPEGVEPENEETSTKDKAKELYEKGKEKGKEVVEKGKEKVKEIDEATKDDRKKAAQKGKELYENGKEKGKEAVKKGKEKINDLLDK